MPSRSLTLGDEEVEQREHYRMAAEHVVAAGAHALDGHAAALPDEVRLVDALHPAAVGLERLRKKREKTQRKDGK